jgi:hypothetical protein
VIARIPRSYGEQRGTSETAKASPFKPIGWTSELMWGNDENARIPLWVAGPVYVVLGLLTLYWWLTGNSRGFQAVLVFGLTN